MAKLSVTRAAKCVDITRGKMRRAIARGDVRPDPDGRVDTDELLRAGYKVKTELIPQDDDATPEQSAGVRQTVKAPSAPGLATPTQAGFHASVSVHLELSGHQVELTLQDTDETRVLARMEALLKQFPRAATFAGATPRGARPSPMRQRIMTLLQDYPAGLKRKDIEQQLHVDPTINLKDTLYGMVRQELLGTRVKGVYVLRAGEGPTKAS